MKLLFRQKIFSWFDSYDIYDEAGNVRFKVKGELAWGHLLRIYDANGVALGYIKQKVFSFLPRFEIHIGEAYIGNIKKEFSLFKPKFNIDYNGWRVEGRWTEWEYSIFDMNEKCIAQISKQLFKLTDMYTIDVYEEKDALSVLMLVLAIDAEKCSRND